MSPICPFCFETENKKIEMIEEHDTIICKACGTSYFITGKDPLNRYFKEWKKNAEGIDVFLRPALYQQDLSNPMLFNLYEDCYHTLLIGRYNASIVMMGILLEALMKERIILKTNKELGKSYGTSLNVIKDLKLMSQDHITFLEKFKNDIRDLYQHSNEKEIVKGKVIRTWRIDINKDKPLESIKTGVKDVKQGKISPVLIPSTEPVVRSVVKQEHDKKMAIVLFNEVYDFLLICNNRYFKQEEYDEA